MSLEEIVRTLKAQPVLQRVLQQANYFTGLDISSQFPNQATQMIRTVENQLKPFLPIEDYAWLLQQMSYFYELNNIKGQYPQLTADQKSRYRPGTGKLVTAIQSIKSKYETALPKFCKDSGIDYHDMCNTLGVLDSLLSDVEKMEKELGVPDKLAIKINLWDERTYAKIKNLNMGQLSSEFDHVIGGIYYKNRQDCRRRLKERKDILEVAVEEMRSNPSEYFSSKQGDKFMSSNNTILCGISFEPDDTKDIESWAKVCPVEIATVITFFGIFKKNLLKRSKDMEIEKVNVSGFVVNDHSEFDRRVLYDFYLWLSENDLYLYSTNNSCKPFSDEDFSDMVEEESTQSGNPINIKNLNVQGILNLGIMRQIDSLNVSISNVQDVSPEFGQAVKDLTNALLESDDLTDAQKEEAVGRLDAITVEVEKEPTERKNWAIVDNVRALNEFFKAGSNLQTFWAGIIEVLQQLPDLPSIPGITS